MLLGAGATGFIICFFVFVFGVVLFALVVLVDEHDSSRRAAPIACLGGAGTSGCRIGLGCCGCDYVGEICDGCGTVAVLVAYSAATTATTTTCRGQIATPHKYWIKYGFGDWLGGGSRGIG